MTLRGHTKRKRHCSSFDSRALPKRGASVLEGPPEPCGKKRTSRPEATPPSNRSHAPSTLPRVYFLHAEVFSRATGEQVGTIVRNADGAWARARDLGQLSHRGPFHHFGSRRRGRELGPARAVVEKTPFFSQS